MFNIVNRFLNSWLQWGRYSGVGDPDHLRRITTLIRSRINHWPTRLFHLKTSQLHTCPDEIASIVAQDIAPALGLQATDEAILEEFNNSARYAVLSHHPTSGEADSKFKRFCDKAREFNCQYVWFDAECVETTSAETEYTVRSLFSWFENAYLCIVYLGQTDGPIIGEDNLFKRGWVLQELLAPRRLRFYNQKWVPLTNDKYDIDRTTKKYNDGLVKQISKLSGIGPADLEEFSPKNVDIRRILTWVSNKVEARPEDLVHCLIGFIDRVTIGVSSGEGLESVFRKLQIALLQSYDNRGLFVFDEPHPLHTGILARSPQAFESSLTGVESSFKLFARDQSPNPVVISSAGNLLHVPIIPLAVTQLQTIVSSPFVEVKNLGRINCNSIQGSGGAIIFAILGLRTSSSGDQLVFGVLLQEDISNYKRIRTDPYVLECAAPTPDVISALEPKTVGIEIQTNL